MAKETLPKATKEVRTYALTISNVIAVTVIGFILGSIFMTQFTPEPVSASSSKTTITTTAEAPKAPGQ